MVELEVAVEPAVEVAVLVGMAGVLLPEVLVPAAVDAGEVAWDDATEAGDEDPAAGEAGEPEHPVVSSATSRPVDRTAGIRRRRTVVTAAR
ncbi:hypothetical protein [Terrabacter lapilli]|uniref:hypothetical protein n=1 Tax=Terrabacter lapilli TaxID=436231 RepID=UPI0031DE3B8C